MDHHNPHGARSSPMRLPTELTRRVSHLVFANEPLPLKQIFLLIQETTIERGDFDGDHSSEEEATTARKIGIRSLEIEVLIKILVGGSRLCRSNGDRLGFVGRTRREAEVMIARTDKEVVVLQLLAPVEGFVEEGLPCLVEFQGGGLPGEVTRSNHSGDGLNAQIVELELDGIPGGASSCRGCLESERMEVVLGKVQIRDPQQVGAR